MIRNNEQQIFASVDAREEALTALSREIWEYAEPGLKEVKSSRAIAKFLEAEGFRVAVVLPRGTNTAVPGAAPLNEEDRWLTARNKWLLAHSESSEAAQGAHIGLKGENIDIAADI